MIWKYNSNQKTTLLDLIHPLITANIRQETIYLIFRKQTRHKIWIRHLKMRQTTLSVSNKRKIYNQNGMTTHAFNLRKKIRKVWLSGTIVSAKISVQSHSLTTHKICFKTHNCRRLSALMLFHLSQNGNSTKNHYFILLFYLQLSIYLLWIGDIKQIKKTKIRSFLKKIRIITKMRKVKKI